MTKRRKIIIVGPVGAGKTTAIRSLTDNRCIVTDVKSSESASLHKELTTVAMDFGIVPIADDVLHVYGAPGQQRFSFMWDILTVGAYGIVMLIDNCSKDPKHDLCAFLSAFAPQIAATRFILGVTRTDLKADPPLEDYARWLGEYGINAEVACVDPREKDDVLFLLDRLLDTESGHTKTPFAPYEGEEAGPGPLTDIAEETRLDNLALGAAGSLKGVTGISLTNGLGETVQSTMSDNGLKSVSALLTGLAQTLEETAGLGPIRSVALRSPHDENLTVLLGPGGRALGLTSSRYTALPLPWQKVEELGQWVLR